MPQPKRLDEIEQACQELLSRSAGGISEYSLLKRLREEPYTLFPRLAPGDQLGLFQSHFLLFHALYRLRDRLHAEQSAILRISALLIEMEEYRGGEAALCEADPLREYYLELENLSATGEAEVATLLRDFWQQVQLAPGEVSAALEVLELEQASDFAQVKSQYRSLVMRHHPDRGGEAAKMHELNEALEVMRLHFRC